MSVLLRTLTKKSKIGFGKYRDRTVGDLIERRKHKHLINIYYKLDSINFTEEVLKELLIKDDYIINKPSKCIVTLKKYIENDYYFFRNETVAGAINKLKKPAKFTKGFLQSKNHNK